MNLYIISRDDAAEVASAEEASAEPNWYFRIELDTPLTDPGAVARIRRKMADGKWKEAGRELIKNRPTPNDRYAGFIEEAFAKSGHPRKASSADAQAAEASSPRGSQMLIEILEDFGFGAPIENAARLVYDIDLGHGNTGRQEAARVRQLKGPKLKGALRDNTPAGGKEAKVIDAFIDDRPQ